MYQVEQQEPSIEFKKAWLAAARHIQNQGQGAINWLRTDLNPPLAEHLSFRIGNRLFFIFVEAAEFGFEADAGLFLKVAKEADAIPCILPMAEHLSEFKPCVSGWGLVHAETHQELNPLDLVDDALVEMSDWEVHDFAIQMVKSTLEKEGKNVFSAQSSLHIDPSIWYEEAGQPYWVVVRAARYPDKEASVPANIADIKDNCARMVKTGYFANVGVANADDPFDPDARENGNFLPLYRGYGMIVRFEGLSQV